MQIHSSWAAALAFGLLLPLTSAAAQGPCSDVGHCQSALWAVAGGAAEQRNGAAVALGADFAAVGTRDGDAVRIYVRVASQWQHAQTLVDPEGSGHRFGEALATDGPWLFVGAPRSNTAGLGGTGSGGVHVYQRVGNVWTHHHKLVDPTPWTNGGFGTSVSAHGQWLAVGAPDHAVAGRVHVWSYDNGGPVLVRTIGSLAAAMDFGQSVALFREAGTENAYVLVGDPGDPFAGPDAGSARYFRVTWAFAVQSAAIRPAGLAAGDRFGRVVAFDGAHMVVGAPGDDQAGLDAGAAYVYDVAVPGALEPMLANKLTACNAAPFAYFGAAVAVRGNRLIVGAPGHENQIGALAPYRGAVHVFQPALGGATWVAKSRVASADPAARLFGSAVAFDATLLLAGAPGSVHQGVGAGAAYLHSIAADSHPGGVCSSAHLATMVTYGVGKAGALGVPELQLSKPPTPGIHTSIVAQGFPGGTVPLLLVGVAPAAMPFDGGFMLVADPFTIQMPAIGITGKSGIGWNVGTDPAVQGIPLFLQVIGLDPGAAGALSLAQSAGLAIAVGW